MRILLVGAGASFSIKDVETGYVHAFQAAGVDVKVYQLDQRLGLAYTWLQKLWKARGKDPELRPSWADTLYRGGIEALEMALRFEVDWVIAISAMYLHPDVLEMMRRAGLRTAVLFTESPYDDNKQARVAALVDVCWTNERVSVPVLRHFNPRTFYLRHAFDPARHTTLAEAGESSDVPAHDVVFVGSGFEERIELLGAINWVGIDLGLYGSWTLLSSKHRLRRHVRGGVVDNARTAELYRRARIGLNLHRTSREYGWGASHIREAESMNPRGYELAACGVFQISDRRAEVGETFGETVYTFETAEQLEHLIRRSLERVAECHTTALEARQHILPHTFAARAAQILADLERVSARPIAKGA